MKYFDYVPDHTAAIQRTGYPTGIDGLPLCSRCHQEIGWEERVYEGEEGWICVDCFLEAIEELGPEILAMDLGIATDRAYDAFSRTEPEPEFMGWEMQKTEHGMIW